MTKEQFEKALSLRHKFYMLPNPLEPTVKIEEIIDIFQTCREFDQVATDLAKADFVLQLNDIIDSKRILFDAEIEAI